MAKAKTEDTRTQRQKFIDAARELGTEKRRRQRVVARLRPPPAPRPRRPRRNLSASVRVSVPHAQRMDRSCAPSPSPRSTEGELWNCAIPDAADAEKAVRRTCDPVGVLLITARTRLAAHEVEELGLQDGQVRKRPAG